MLKLCLLCVKEIPEEVWECGSAARVLDVSENFIREVPARISSFTSIHVRMLVANVYFKKFLFGEAFICICRNCFFKGMVCLTNQFNGKG